MKVIRNIVNDKLRIFVIIVLMLSLMIPLSLMMIVDAASSSTWNDDLAEWKSYGQNGWTETKANVPKWSGTNVAASQTGDSQTNPLAIPQQLASEKVTYYQMNQMSDGSWRLEMPKKVEEDVTYYAVYSPEQFRYAMTRGYHIKLMQDLDMVGNDGRSWSAVAFTNQVFIDGNGHTIYNLNGNCLISSWSQPLIVKDLKVSSASLTEGLLGRSTSNTYISIEDVALEHAIVTGGNSHLGGLVSAAYYRSSGSFARVYANRCHTKNVYVYNTSGSCSGNIFGPISGYVENCYAIDGTMRTNSHSGAFTSCAGNYIIQNCFTNVRAYASSNTGAFVGHVEDSQYTPGGDGVTKFINCYASGSVEGSTNMGGFAAGAGVCGANYPCNYLFENCYSTAMVGMLGNGNNQGGFLGCQEANANSVFRNCYAAGEVGTLGTNLEDASPMGGFVGGHDGGTVTLENCYYDKQTTAMKEKAGYGNATGLLTQELMKTLPDGKSASESAWVLTDGTYPQLKIFANNENYSGEDKNNTDAYSKASVCTAILYPSNISEKDFETIDKTDYDTVRSLRFLFPLTNNTLANTTGSYDISWESDGTKCAVDGMEDADVVAIKSADPKNPSDDYTVMSLAPGVSMVTVSVKTNGVTGQRQLRLVPTSAITMVQNTESNVTSGLDATIYAVPDGEKTDETLNVNYLTYKEVNYDHRIGMFFASGNSMGQNVQKQGLEGIKQDTVDEFSKVVLNEQPGGTVLTTIQKKMPDGTLKDLTTTEDLVKLFTSKRAALSKDIGEYYFNYRWYLNNNNVGSNNGYLQTRKKLTILPAVTPVYYRNYDSKDKTQLSLPNGVIPADQKALYYKNGDVLGNLPTNPERVGYEFSGWSLSQKGFGEDDAMKVDKETKIDTDWANDNYKVEFYAIWKAKKIPIQYQDDDETIDGEQETDKPIKLPEEKPKKPDHSFVGWTPDPNGKEPYPDLDEKTLLDLLEDYPELLEEDIVFYPVFEKNPDPEVKVKVENKTDPDGENVQVYDVLKYTITAKNKEDETKWKDVKIKNQLPAGLTLVEDSIKLIDPDGKEIILNSKDVYNKETHTIEIPIELIEGGTEYRIEYDVYVNGKAVNEKDKDIHNTIKVEGKNPDGSEANTENKTVLPDGGEDIVLADPEPEIKVEVENKTRPVTEKPKVGDELKYTIEVENKREHSDWLDAIIEKEIPDGLEIISEYIEIEYPDGHKEKIKLSDVYDEETRILKIPLGDIHGKEKYKIYYDVRVEKDDVNLGDDFMDIEGNTPSKKPVKVDKEESESDILGEDFNNKVKTEDEANIALWLYTIGASVSLYMCLVLDKYKKRKLNEM